MTRIENAGEVAGRTYGFVSEMTGKVTGAVRVTFSFFQEKTGSETKGNIEYILLQSGCFRMDPDFSNFFYRQNTSP